MQPWDDSGARFSQPMHAADLAAFIQSLGAGPVHVVAWSYGGSVATLAASLPALNVYRRVDVLSLLNNG